MIHPWARKILSKKIFSYKSRCQLMYFDVLNVAVVLNIKYVTYCVRAYVFLNVLRDFCLIWNYLKLFISYKIHKYKFVFKYYFVQKQHGKEGISRLKIKQKEFYFIFMNFDENTNFCALCGSACSKKIFVFIRVIGPSQKFSLNMKK